MIAFYTNTLIHSSKAWVLSNTAFLKHPCLLWKPLFLRGFLLESFKECKTKSHLNVSTRIFSMSFNIVPICWESTPRALTTRHKHSTPERTPRPAYHTLSILLNIRCLVAFWACFPVSSGEAEAAWSMRSFFRILESGYTLGVPSTSRLKCPEDGWSLGIPTFVEVSRISILGTELTSKAAQRKPNQDCNSGNLSAESDWSFVYSF